MVGVRGCYARAGHRGEITVIPAGIRKWAAIGSGAGLEIVGPRGSESLRISAVRVRPRGARVLGGFTVEDFQHQPAAAWGADYAAFLGKLGIRHVAADVVLPRHEVIIRQLSLPGVSGKDLAGAVQFQLDGLHPYNEDDVVSSWTRLEHSSTVLVAIVRGEVIQRYATLFAEAGIKIAGFTCSAAAAYSALRLFGNAPPSEILAYEAGENGVEIYGESPAKPVFSAAFNIHAHDGELESSELERAAAQASAELRFETAPPMRPLHEMLGADPALPYAAALTSACPRSCLPLNLLPVEQRQTSSPMVWVPSTVLAALVLLAAGATTALPGFENRGYLRELNAEIAKVQPAAARAAAIDRDIDLTRKRTLLLDAFRARSKADMDVLAEMTRLLAAPAWLTSLDLNGQQVNVTGETDQAAVLLKAIDASPQFESSEFVSPPQRTPTGEMFRIRTTREGSRQGNLP
jgi:Tfp pilus assembly protein PilN